LTWSGEPDFAITCKIAELAAARHRYVEAEELYRGISRSRKLIVWDVPAPLDWGFAKYNDDAAAAREAIAHR